ncbi:MAG: hypothetical protein JNM78_19845 [Cyclobacteriaceae bacterium]|nr:hypothetical protein [Cyclobacteriaceae bacterium]
MSLVFCCTAIQAQRLFFGLGMQLQSYHHANTEKYYVLPSRISYDVEVVKKKQSQFVFNYPALHVLTGVEYGRWRFTLEPGIQPLNFSYSVYYPTGNGLIRTPDKIQDVEDYDTQMVGFALPALAHYAIWNSRSKDQNIYLQAGASYFQNFSSENSRNVFYQKNYTWAVGGLSYQFGGFYRPNFSLRYNHLLAVHNAGELQVGFFNIGFTCHLPSIKVQKRKLYSDEVD